MASVTLSQSRRYRLVHPDQDWHGWNVYDTGGGLVGRVADFIIDTEQSRAVALVLDSGGTVPLDDVLVGDTSLTVAGDAPPRPGAQSLQPFEAGTFDVPERVEIAVFKTRPFVVEELVISRDVVERTAHIHTTVRRRDVEVEHIPEPQRVRGRRKR